MYEPIELARYDVSADRGFLPRQDPRQYLSYPFRYWEGFAQEMPALLASNKFGAYLHTMPIVDAHNLPDSELALAHMRLTFVLHGYIRECQLNNVEFIRVPECLGMPLVAIAKRLGLPPVLSYAPYALHNWRRIDPEKPVVLEILAVLQNFLGGLDESWFIMVHVEIEAHAGRAIEAAVRAQEAAAQNDLYTLRHWLQIMAIAEHEMHRALSRMPEGCDPYIYYRRVRPYLFVPEGVTFEGISKLGNTPRPFRGETGAQSTIAPLFDAVLGVVHEPSDLSAHLAEMRWYMPPKHRALLEEVEKREPVSNKVLGFHDTLRAYNECVEWLARFREKHYEYATSYIHKQTRVLDNSNPTDIGTGRTRFMASLKKHVDETRKAMF